MKWHKHNYHKIVSSMTTVNKLSGFILQWKLNSYVCIHLCNRSYFNLDCANMSLSFDWSLIAIIQHSSHCKHRCTDFDVNSVPFC